MSRNASVDDPLLAGLTRLSASHAPRQSAPHPPRTEAPRPPAHAANPPSLSSDAPTPPQPRFTAHPASVYARKANQPASAASSTSHAPHTPLAGTHSPSTSHQSSRNRYDSDLSSAKSASSRPHGLPRPEPWTAPPPVPPVTPLNPLHRSEIIELIEQTTGLGRSIGGDSLVADQLLKLVQSGSLPPRTICEHVVAGSGPNEVKVNVRVLWLLHYLMAKGGPLVLPDVVQAPDGRSPPAVQLVLNVLRSYGYETDSEALDVLHDDEKARAMSLPTDRRIPEDALRKSRGERTYEAVAVETYAIALGRKAWFHYRYSAVEVNYSLDRFYRAWHVENDCDPNMYAKNEETIKLTQSSGALQDMYLLVHTMTAAVQRLHRARFSFSLCLQPLADACNAYSYALYLRKKPRFSGEEGFDLERHREVLAFLLGRFEQRGEKHHETVLRYVDKRVYDLVVGKSSDAVRPESRHRREIEIEVTSFEALHRAFEYLRGRNKVCAG